MNILEHVKPNQDCSQCDVINDYVCFDCEHIQVKAKYPKARYMGTDGYRLVNTDTIFSTALAYASYKSMPMKVDDNLIEQMFKDLIDLSDEYGFDYKSLIKELD